MKRLHKVGVVYNAGSQFLAVRFEIDPPAAIHINISDAQGFKARLSAEQPMPPWGNYEWKPNLYAGRYPYLRVPGPHEAFPSLSLDPLF
jgi:hypothetical protein